MKVKKKKKKKVLLTIVKILILIIFSLGILGGVAFAGVTLAIVKTAPELDLNSILTLSEPSVLYNDKGEVMDEAPTLEKREIVSIKDVPSNLANAFVSIEDERFYKHNGVDPQRLAGVVWLDVQRFVKGNRTFQGASTITQQLLKNTLLNDDVTIQRKVQEMYLALQLEKTLSKEQILEAYMNTINLGGQVHGVQKAAKYYFNKDVKNLSLIECAYIAGVTQFPYKYDAFSPKAEPKLYLDRTKTVVSQMEKNGYIDKDTEEKALADLNDNKLVFEKPKSAADANRLNYEWFSRPVMDAVKADLKKTYSLNNDEVEKLLMYGGLKIYTTMNADMENAAQAALNNDKNLGIKSSGNINDPKNIVEPQGSAVVMDYHTGEVKVIIGGRGIQPAGSYNRAASKDYLRPTGSSIKPITVYSPAIDTKIATAATVIEDSPLSEEIGKRWPQADGKPYDPQNYDSEGFQGYMTLRDALRQSINLVAIKLEYQLGLSTGLSYAEKFGITYDDKSKTSISALALGEFKGSNTLTMAAAYGVFGNNGMYTSPILYRKVVDKTGKVLLENKPVSRKVLSPQSSYIMYDLLKGPTGPGGTGPSSRFGSMPVAGKTGTSGDKKDFWFCGVTPYYSGAVWLGNDMPTKRTDISSNVAANVFGRIMEKAHANLPVKDIDKPSGIYTSAVCSVSGKLPTDLCTKDPRGSKVYTEMFMDGTGPSTLCDTHVEVKVNKNNGKIATEFTPKELIENRIFIKRDYKPSKPVNDQYLVAPTEVDDTKPVEPEKKDNPVTDIINNLLNGNQNNSTGTTGGTGTTGSTNTTGNTTGNQTGTTTTNH